MNNSRGRLTYFVIGLVAGGASVLVVIAILLGVTGFMVDRWRAGEFYKAFTGVRGREAPLEMPLAKSDFQFGQYQGRRIVIFGSGPGDQNLVMFCDNTRVAAAFVADPRAPLEWVFVDTNAFEAWLSDEQVVDP